MTAVLSFGENALSISIIIPTAIAGCLVLFFVIRAVSWRAGCKDMKICITYKGKSITFRALCDSGNLIRDPFSGKPVIIISRDELSMLLGTVATNALMTCDTEMLRSLGIMPRIIPRGSEMGHDLMCAFSPEKAVITTDRRSMERDVLIAPANTPRGYYAGYPATAPSLLIP